MKKEGLTWIGKRTGQYRYSVNGADQWLQPLSIYTAGEDIKRGQVVSIALPSDFTGSTRIVATGIVNDDNLVVKTRPDRHMKACGIALENAAAGEKLHLQNAGRIKYDMAKTTEYFPAFLNSDRGKLVYVGNAGELTLSLEEAVIGSRNLIQVGMISETSSQLPTAGDLTIEIQFEGDGRGPLEATQFEVAFGEPHAYTTVNGNLPPRVFAVGMSDAVRFRYNLRVPRPNVAFPSLDNNPNSWLAIYSSWFAYIVIFGSSTIPQSATQEDSDKLQYILQQAKTSAYAPLYASSEPPALWGSPQTTQAPIVDETGTQNLFVNSVLTALSAPAANAVFGPGQDVQLSPSIQNVVVDPNTGAQLEVLAQLSGSSEGGPVYIDWDSSLDAFFNTSSYEEQGSYNVAGRAVIADRRFPERANVLGLLLKAEEHEFETGETAIFLRKGTYVAKYDAFQPGVTYYAGIDGQLTPYGAAFKYPDVITRIGIAKTSRRLIVDVGEPTVSRVAGMPIGGIKSLPAGINVAEKGFLLMDGITVHQSEFYPELLAELEARFPIEDIYTDETQAAFYIPALENTTNGNYYQIKATTYGYEPFTTSSIQKRSIGVVSSRKVPDIDITDLSFVGPKGAFEDITIDRIFPRLFVEVPTQGWREIPAGFNVVNGTTYGYSWSVVSSDSTYTLQMDIGAGEGLAFVGDSSAPIILNGQSYRALIMKPDSFARYSEFDLDIAQTTIGDINTSTNLPIRSEAVTKYIDNNVTTRQLTVHNSTVLGDGAAGDSDTVTMNADVTINNGNLTFSNNASPKIVVHGATGLIETAAVMSPLDGTPNTATNTSLVTKSYVDDHRRETVSDTYDVHGIKVGHNGGFSADMVDGFHASQSAGDGEIPVITVSTSGGTLQIRRFLRFHRPGSSSFSTIFDSTSDTDLSVYGASNTRFTLGIGNTNRRYIGNNDGQLEILNGATVGTNYGTLKAQEFYTVSSGQFKTNIKPFKSALELLNNVEIVKYVYKGHDEPQVGFIAENTDALLSGPKQDSMNIASSVGVLIRAVQELSQQNAALIKRIEALEK